MWISSKAATGFLFAIAALGLLLFGFPAVVGFLPHSVAAKAPVSAVNSALPVSVATVLDGYERVAAQRMAVGSIREAPDNAAIDPVSGRVAKGASVTPSKQSAQGLRELATECPIANAAGRTPVPEMVVRYVKNEDRADLLICPSQNLVIVHLNHRPEAILDASAESAQLRSLIASLRL